MLNKKEIRKVIKEQKRMMTTSEIERKSMKIAEHLYQTEQFKQAASVFVYVNYNQEVMTIPIIRKCFSEGKNVFVPKVHNNIILFHQIMNIEKDLKPGAYGILEPVTTLVDQSHDGLLLMPGLAFDKTHHRIGYGGGFYDKYLSQDNQHYKMALAYDFQILDAIETEECDIRVDQILTEQRML